MMFSKWAPKRKSGGFDPMDEFNIGPLLDMAFDESEAKANDMSLNFVIMLMLNRWLPGVSAMMPIAAGVAVIAFGKILFSRG